MKVTRRKVSNMNPRTSIVGDPTQELEVRVNDHTVANSRHTQPNTPMSEEPIPRRGRGLDKRSIASGSTVLRQRRESSAIATEHLDASFIPSR